MAPSTRILLAAVLLGSIAVAPPASAHADRSGALRAVVTGKHAELRERVAIGREPWSRPVSALSVELPPLSRRSRITFSGEVTLSTTCVEPIARCIGRTYRFDPHIEARVVLARRTHSTAHRAVLPVSGKVALDCEQTRPNRNHHCPLTVEGAFDIRTLAALPCPPDRCRLNLLVDASHRDSGKRHFVVLGADQPDGSVEGGKARLGAAVSEGRLERSTERTRRLLTKRIEPSFDGGKTVVYSQRLEGLHRGDVLLVRALQVSRVFGLPNFVSAKIIIATRPTAVEPGRYTRRATSRNGTVTETTGFNCTLGPSAFRSPCKTRKVGITELERTPMRKGGRPRPLYLNLVSRGFPKLAQARGYPPIRILDRGYLAFKRLRSPSRDREA